MKMMLSYCAFIRWDISLPLSSVTRVSFFADDTLVYERGVSYQMLWYAQRNTHSLRRLNMPVKRHCAGGNLSPPTPNDHLSLARINEDDRWWRLAVLTEAPRQESSANRRDAPNPVGCGTLVNSVCARSLQDDVWLVNKDEGLKKKNLIPLVCVSCNFKCFCSRAWNFLWITPWALF